jgi:hypothetical protein
MTKEQLNGRDKEICEAIKYYIDLNVFINEEGRIIDNKIGLVQDLYDFVWSKNVK